MRKGLTRYVNDAIRGEQVYAVRNRGHIDAVLLGRDLWLTGCDPEAGGLPVDADMTQFAAFSTLRAHFSDYRMAADVSGIHTLITRYETQHHTREDAIVAVIAPYPWVRTALKDLGEPVTDEDQQQRYRSS